LLKFKILKNILQQHKVFFIFLLKFLLSYFIVTIIYSLYLNQYHVQKNETDGITHFVAQQTENILVFFGANCEIIKHDVEPSYKIIYNSKYIARIVEGCNSVSVIILFAAFIFSFSNRFIGTFLYIFLGSIVIFILNIFRIALLTAGLYKYPEYGTFLHDILFPLVIYGLVFVLWIVWVIKFSAYAKSKK
jgi:exosortase family protein XrtF